MKPDYKNDFRQNFTLNPGSNLPRSSYLLGQITGQTREFTRSDGTQHEIKVLETKNQFIRTLLLLFCTKVTVNNKDFYISNSSIKKITSKPRLIEAGKIQEHFGAPQKGNAENVIKVAKKHFKLLEKDAAELKKGQFQEKIHEGITFTIIKTGQNSYEVSIRGKELGQGALKTAYVSVPIITGKLPKVEYSTEKSQGTKENIKKSEQLEFENYTMLRKKMGSNTNLLLLQKKYTSPTGESKIVAEKCDGDLVQLLQTPSLSPEEKLSLATQGAKVLASVHAAKCVHLDIKPANFLVKTNKEPLKKEIRLSDFEYLQPYGEKTAAGTLSFMAPEIIIGANQNKKNPATYSMDVFSYGATLYALFPLANENSGTKLVNWRPNINIINNNNIAAIEQQRIKDRQTHLRASNNAIHALIADCIDFDPKKRPTMQEVQERLEKELSRSQSS